jgi:hypothetical protein
MNRRLKTSLLFVVDPRSLILAFAVFNFVHVWRLASNACCCGVVNPWFCSWNYTNEPTRYTNEPTTLLVAALFLRANRWWGNIVSLVLSGYLLGYFLHILIVIYPPWDALRTSWQLMRHDYPYIVRSWESQYMLALVIFCVSAFFLIRGILRWNALRRAADNKSLDRSHGKRVSHQA